MTKIWCYGWGQRFMELTGNQPPILLLPSAKFQLRYYSQYYTWGSSREECRSIEAPLFRMWRGLPQSLQPDAAPKGTFQKDAFQMFHLHPDIQLWSSAHWTWERETPGWEQVIMTSGLNGSNSERWKPNLCTTYDKSRIQLVYAYSEEHLFIFLLDVYDPLQGSFSYYTPPTSSKTIFQYKKIQAVRNY